MKYPGHYFYKFYLSKQTYTKSEKTKHMHIYREKNLKMLLSLSEVHRLKIQLNTMFF